MMRINFNPCVSFSYSIALLLFIGLSLSSCQSNKSLSDGGIVQKRKYQKGYHLNIKDPLAFNKSTKRLHSTDMEPTASLDGELKEKTIDPKPTLSAEINKKIQIITQNNEKTKKSKKTTHAVSKKDDAKPLQITSSYTKQDLVITPDPETDYYAGAKQLNTLALLSFIFGVLSFFILGIPFGTAAVVLGVIAIVQIESNPTGYKGKGFAIAGLIIGILAVIIVVSYLSSQP